MTLSYLWSSNDIVLLMRDFNPTPNNPKLNELNEDHELCDLFLEPTCFKSINSTCIDNFLTNKKTREKLITFN